MRSEVNGYWLCVKVKTHCCSVLVGKEAVSDVRPLPGLLPEAGASFLLLSPLHAESTSLSHVAHRLALGTSTASREGTGWSVMGDPVA